MADRLHHRGQARREDSPGRQGRLAGELHAEHRRPDRREPAPAPCSAGDDVISGCVNEEGILRIETTTALRRLHRGKNPGSGGKFQPEEGSQSRTSSPSLPATTPRPSASARWCWPLCRRCCLGNWLDWIMRALTFLVISCPCALVISIPLTFFGGIGGASKCGILVKGGNYLEALSKTSIAVVFDKTGTLTKGVFKVTQVIPINGKAYDLQMMEYAALAESVSNHPIAKSIQRACPDLDPRRVTEAKEIAGQGVKAKVDGHWVLAGNRKLMDAENVQHVPERRGRRQVRHSGLHRGGRQIPRPSGHLRRGQAAPPSRPSSKLNVQGVHDRHADRRLPPRGRVRGQGAGRAGGITAACCLRIKWNGSKNCWLQRGPGPNWPSWATASTTPPS